MDQLARPEGGASGHARVFAAQPQVHASTRLGVAGAGICAAACCTIAVVHLCTLLDKIKEPAARDWYASKSLKHDWSRSVLAMQVETGAHIRTGSAITNFEERLLPPQSSLPASAQGSLHF
ncbi:hypothetical protein [Paraburkholderia phymatum]|uniref:hypothetical protein n=1 Tax=Paraburkholderia phymatum TaxID=148447 RepID=UPI003D186CE7